MMELRISVVYQSGGGHTKVLAESVLAGCQKVADVKAELIEITGKDIVEGRWSNNEIMSRLDSADAIIFGCATYMGSVSAIYKAFLEKAFEQWLVQGWKDKFAAAFTNSASVSRRRHQFRSLSTAERLGERVALIAGTYNGRRGYLTERLKLA